MTFRTASDLLKSREPRVQLFCSHLDEAIGPALRPGSELQTFNELVELF
jgi:hypothetical protein